MSIVLIKIHFIKCLYNKTYFTYYIKPLLYKRCLNVPSLYYVWFLKYVVLYTVIILLCIYIYIF